MTSIWTRERGNGKVDNCVDGHGPVSNDEGEVRSTTADEVDTKIPVSEGVENLLDQDIPSMARA